MRQREKRLTELENRLNVDPYPYPTCLDDFIPWWHSLSQDERADVLEQARAELAEFERQQEQEVNHAEHS